MHLRLLRGAPAAFAGDQLVAPAGERTDDHRLDYAALGDRGGELAERFFVEMAPRLVGMRFDRRDRQAGEPVARPGRLGALVLALHHRRRDQRLLAARFAEQGAEPAAKPALRVDPRIAAVVGAHAATPSLGFALD